MKKIITSIIVYCSGLFIMAIGISLAIISDLGVSPVSSIPYVVSVITGIDLGMCTTTVFICFIGIQWILLGREFRLRNMIQIVVW
ncbi:MAG: hypothetical protein R3Y40_04565 [Eubacteriales bacterium]